MKKYYILSLLIFLLGAFLRFHQLGNIPVGFHRDEAFLGYNAYSILKTGRDMTGHLLPLHLESFLFSPAGYSYFSIPFIALFGLSAFSVRFAAALFGSLTLLLIPLLVSEVFFKRKEKYIFGLATGFFLAISPWHINLSRVATENVLVVFFIMLGIYFYLLWIRKTNWLYFVVSFISFGLTLLIYQAPRAFLPFFLPCLFLFAIKKIKSKQMFWSILAFLIIIILPIIAIVHSPQLSVRIHMLSIFQAPQTQLIINEQIREDGITHAPILATRVFHNKLVGYTTIFLQNYFQHFSYQFLFTDAGLPDRYRIAGMGLLYIFELPLILLGIWFLLNKEKRVGIFLLLWIFLAPLGSALTYDDIPNLQRTLLIFPALSIVSAIGGFFIWNYFKNILLSIILRILCVVIFLYSLLFYLHAYYYHQQVHRPWYRGEGIASLVSAVNQLLPQYTYAEITKEESEPGIFFLFYNHFNPATFQQLFKQHPTAHYGNLDLPKYRFSELNCPMDETQKIDQQTGKVNLIAQGNPQVLYVNGQICKIPQNHAQVLKTIKRNDGTVVFRILRFIQ